MHSLDNGIAVSFQQLMGEGPYLDVNQQITYPRLTHEQISSLALKVWHKIPDTKMPTGSLAAVKQEAAETYLSFIDRLGKAITRQTV